jgi:hypothetical protein
LSEFLAPDELRALTGYKPVSSQIAWLRENRIPHRAEDGDTRIIVSRYHVTQAEIAKTRLAAAMRDLDRYVIRPDAPTIKADEYPPDGSFCGIYMLFDSSGAVTYVGQSQSVGNRVTQHFWAMRRGARGRFVEYAAVPVPWECLDGMEIAHIYALRPPENCLPRATWDKHAEAVALVEKAWDGRKTEE